VKVIHRGAKVYYLEAGLPYPLPNRDMHIYGIGVNRLYENGTVMIMAKSVDHVISPSKLLTHFPCL